MRSSGVELGAVFESRCAFGAHFCVARIFALIGQSGISVACGVLIGARLTVGDETIQCGAKTGTGISICCQASVVNGSPKLCVSCLLQLHIARPTLQGVADNSFDAFSGLVAVFMVWGILAIVQAPAWTGVAAFGVGAYVTGAIRAAREDNDKHFDHRGS